MVLHGFLSPGAMRLPSHDLAARKLRLRRGNQGHGGMLRPRRPVLERMLRKVIQVAASRCDPGCLFEIHRLRTPRMGQKGGLLE